MKSNTISIKSSDYPEILRHIPDAPPLLFVRGTLHSGSQPMVAIVGSRKPTAYGRAITQQLATALAERGVPIVSGLALGIDAVAHQACLAAGGVTYAVLPTDVDHPYPRTHETLAEQIMKHEGALISEYKYNPRPARWDFLKRNRLVSGLAQALIVTEAGVRSGTMSTVAHALGQGKDVYAVPGPITSPLSAGCNQLIAQGATPITSVESLLDAIVPGSHDPEPTYAYSAEEAAIISALEQGICDGDDLCRASKLDPAVFLRTVTLLELRGAIRALGANQWAL